jgi:hypothetical protein
MYWSASLGVGGGDRLLGQLPEDPLQGCANYRGIRMLGSTVVS